MTHKWGEIGEGLMIMEEDMLERNHIKEVMEGSNPLEVLIHITIIKEEETPTRKAVLEDLRIESLKK